MCICIACEIKSRHSAGMGNSACMSVTCVLPFLRVLMPAARDQIAPLGGYGGKQLRPVALLQRRKAEFLELDARKYTQRFLEPRTRTGCVKGTSLVYFAQGLNAVMGKQV